MYSKTFELVNRLLRKLFKKEEILIVTSTNAIITGLTDLLVVAVVSRVLRRLLVSRINLQFLFLN